MGIGWRDGETRVYPSRQSCVYAVTHCYCHKYQVASVWGLDLVSVWILVGEDLVVDSVAVV